MDPQKKEKYNKNGSIKSSTKFEELDPKEHKLKNLNTMLEILQDEYTAICRELLEKPSKNWINYCSSRHTIV